MAEKETKVSKGAKEAKPEKAKRPQEEEGDILVRIYGYDIPGSRNIYAGLTRIKGISWAISNAVCLKLGYSRTKKIAELSKSEIMEIEKFLKNIDVPDYMKNRRSDRETGKTEHFYGTDLEMKKEFDIKRLKEIKSYKGIRHSLKLPVRGQRTKSHFRSKKVATGMKRGVKK